MNHRCGERRNVQQTVLLRRRGWRGSVVSRIRNVSVGGAFIEVPAASLPLYSQVRLELKLPGSTSGRIVHCNAMVVRVARDGVGLAFEEIAPGALDALWQIPAPPGSAVAPGADLPTP